MALTFFLLTRVEYDRPSETRTTPHLPFRSLSSSTSLYIGSFGGVSLSLVCMTAFFVSFFCVILPLLSLTPPHVGFSLISVPVSLVMPYPCLVYEW